MLIVKLTTGYFWTTNNVCVYIKQYFIHNVKADFDRKGHAHGLCKSTETKRIHLHGLTQAYVI
jgi:hypothetical protein